MLVRDVLFRARLFDQLTEFVGELALDLEEQGLAQIPPESVKAATIMITIGPIIPVLPVHPEILRERRHARLAEGVAHGSGGR